MTEFDKTNILNNLIQDRSLDFSNVKDVLDTPAKNRTGVLPGLLSVGRGFAVSSLGSAIPRTLVNLEQLYDDFDNSFLDNRYQQEIVSPQELKESKLNLPEGTTRFQFNVYTKYRNLIDTIEKTRQSFTGDDIGALNSFLEEIAKYPLSTAFVSATGVLTKGAAFATLPLLAEGTIATGETLAAQLNEHILGLRPEKFDFKEAALVGGLTFGGGKALGMAGKVFNSLKFKILNNTPDLKKFKDFSKPKKAKDKFGDTINPELSEQNIIDDVPETFKDDSNLYGYFKKPHEPNEIETLGQKFQTPPKIKYLEKADNLKAQSYKTFSKIFDSTDTKIAKDKNMKDTADLFEEVKNARSYKEFKNKAKEFEDNLKKQTKNKTTIKNITKKIKEIPKKSIEGIKGIRKKYNLYDASKKAFEAFMENSGSIGEFDDIQTQLKFMFKDTDNLIETTKIKPQKLTYEEFSKFQDEDNYMNKLKFNEAKVEIFKASNPDNIGRLQNLNKDTLSRFIGSKFLRAGYSLLGNSFPKAKNVDLQSVFLDNLDDVMRDFFKVHGDLTKNIDYTDSKILYDKFFLGLIDTPALKTHKITKTDLTDWFRQTNKLKQNTQRKIDVQKQIRRTQNIRNNYYKKNPQSQYHYMSIAYKFNNKYPELFKALEKDFLMRQKMFIEKYGKTKGTAQANLWLKQFLGTKIDSLRHNILSADNYLLKEAQKNINRNLDEVSPLGTRKASPAEEDFIRMNFSEIDYGKSEFVDIYVPELSASFDDKFSSIFNALQFKTSKKPRVSKDMLATRKDIEVAEKMLDEQLKKRQQKIKKLAKRKTEMGEFDRKPKTYSEHAKEIYKKLYIDKPNKSWEEQVRIMSMFDTGFASEIITSQAFLDAFQPVRHLIKDLDLAKKDVTKSIEEPMKLIRNFMRKMEKQADEGGSFVDVSVLKNQLAKAIKEKDRNKKIDILKDTIDFMTLLQNQITPLDVVEESAEEFLENVNKALVNVSENKIDDFFMKTKDISKYTGSEIPVDILEKEFINNVEQIAKLYKNEIPIQGGIYYTDDMFKLNMEKEIAFFQKYKNLNPIEIKYFQEFPYFKDHLKYIRRGIKRGELVPDDYDSDRIFKYVSDQILNDFYWKAGGKKTLKGERILRERIKLRKAILDEKEASMEALKNQNLGDEGVGGLPLMALLGGFTAGTLYISKALMKLNQYNDEDMEVLSGLIDEFDEIFDENAINQIEQNVR